MVEAVRQTSLWVSPVAVDCMVRLEFSGENVSLVTCLQRERERVR